MAFTQEQLAKLKQIWAEEKTVKIAGITNLGQTFETEGRIATDDKGFAGIREKKLWIEFGKEKEVESRKQTKWFAPYDTTIEEGRFLSDFVIFSVECDGEKIFENPEREELHAIARKNRSIAEAERKNEGRDEIVSCPVVDFLKTKIGQPVRIRNLVKEKGEWDWVVHDGVLLGIDGCTLEGYPIIQLADGPGLSNDFVMAATLVSGVGDDMAFEVVYRNDNEDFENQRVEIADRIEDLRNQSEI